MQIFYGVLYRCQKSNESKRWTKARIPSMRKSFCSSPTGDDGGEGCVHCSGKIPDDSRVFFELLVIWTSSPPVISLIFPSVSISISPFIVFPLPSRRGSRLPSTIWVRMVPERDHRAMTESEISCSWRVSAAISGSRPRLARPSVMRMTRFFSIISEKRVDVCMSASQILVQEVSFSL